jgi:hypothetical protein
MQGSNQTLDDGFQIRTAEAVHILWVMQFDHHMILGQGG